MATIFKSTGHAQFDKLLEKATSNLLLEPEWTSIISICDLIRQKDCQPKYAIGQLKKKLHSPNPHVSYFGLQVLESVVKNCGSQIHDEVATKQFMEELRELAKTTQHENIREKILELIQTWAHAFRKISSYRAVQDVLNIMKQEGAKFPPLVEADAMFVADQAPEWADGECCHRCRVEFSFTQRKHHCRACGQIFCGKCSSKECTLPRFGIEKEVRVCDSCFEKYGREGGSSGASTSSSEEQQRTTYNNGLPAGKQPSSNDKTPQGNSSSGGGTTGGTGGPSQKELELAEEEQLQLALAISQSEAEAKEQEMKKKRVYSSNNAPAKIETTRTTSPPPTTTTQQQQPEDPELSRYLNRSYWENKSAGVAAAASPQQNNEKAAAAGSFTPSAPLKLSTAGYQQDLSVNSSTPPIIQQGNNSIAGGLSLLVKQTEQDITIDNFVETLRSQIEMFVNRMKSNSSRGRPIANDTSVQSLFMSITHMHSQLLAYIQVQDNARAQYELLQDKLNQVRDARAALDDLRNEHAEAIRRQQEEQERIRAYQMAQKLALMRQKKNEYLQYQRQLAMQRMQEQEREMQMRIQQQQQQVAWGGQGGGGPPPPPQHGYPPQHNMQGPQQQGMPQQMYQQWVNNGAQPPPPQQMGGQQQPQMISSPTSQPPPQMMYEGQQLGGHTGSQEQIMQMQGGQQMGTQPQQQMGPQPPPQQQQQMGPPQQPPPQQMGPQPPPPQQQQMGPPPQPPPQQNMPAQVTHSQQQIQQIPSTQNMASPPHSNTNIASPPPPPPQVEQQPPQPTPIAELISFD